MDTPSKDTHRAPDEPGYIRQMDGLLKRIGPAVKPVFWILLGGVIAILALISSLAAKHLTFGWERLDMQNTANMAQVIAGTVGTMLSALASLLLIMTLLVQINEYRATRAELIASVEVQKQMAKANAAQIAPLLEQVRISRQAMKLELLTGLIVDLKNDMRNFRVDEIDTDAQGCREVIPIVLAKFQEDMTRRTGLSLLKMPEDAAGYLPVFTRTLMQLDQFLERAELIIKDLDDVDLPGTIRQIRRNDLLLFVNMELRELANQFKAVEVQLRGMDIKIAHLARMKEECLAMLDRTFERILRLNRIPLTYEA